MKKQIYLMVVAACLGLLTKAQTVIPSYVPTNGLVGWWPFNGNANDESGNGNNGIINGPVLTSDRSGNVGKAYSFDGLDDFITLSNYPTTGNQSFSIFNWVKTPSIATRRQIISYGSNNTLQGAWFYVGTDSLLHFDLSLTNGPTSTIKIGNNNWHFVGIINNSGLIQLFVDGVASGASLSMSPNILTGGKTIGSSIINDNWYFNGVLDDIGIWSRVLTACEIKKLYTSGSFSVSSSASNTICVGQSLNLTATGASTYNWNTGATSQNISVSPTVSTVYTVSTTYSAGCTDSRTFSVTVNACTGLNEAEPLTNSVRIFPNPAKEQLSIMINNNAVMGKKYSITNTLGQEVASGIFNKQTTELNIQQLSVGMYQLNIEGLNENYKFIKE